MDRHRNLVALAGYGLLAAIFYGPVLVGGRTFPQSDFTDYFYLLSTFLRNELWAGRLPLWNSYTFAGHPFLANVEAGTFYPVSDLLLVLTLPGAGPGARLYWLQLDAVLHVALAGFFTYLLVRDLTGRRAAAFLAGCVFAFSGYLTGYPPLQLNVLRTAIWLPLLLWLLWRAFGQLERWRWWVGAALVYATAFLAGHPQTFLYISYASLAWILFLLIRSRRRFAACLWRIGVFYLLSAALTAAQMWPSLELARHSIRASANYALVGGGLALRDTAQIFLPHVLSQFSPLYVGLAGLGLALLASEYRSLVRTCPPLTGQGTRTSISRAAAPGVLPFFAVLAVVSLLLSYGHNSFLYPVLFRWLPGWDLFRNQERAAYLVAFGLSVLAGYGAEVVAVLPVPRRRLAGIIYAVVAAICVAVIAIWVQKDEGLPVDAAKLRWAVVVAAVVLAAWSALIWEGRWQRWRSTVLIVLVLVDLFAINLATNLARFDPTPLPEAQAIQAAVHAHSTASLGLPGRVHNEHRIPTDYGVGVAVEDVGGFGQMRLARYETLFDGFPVERMWRLLGVEYLLTWRDPTRLPQAELLSWFPATDGATFLYRLRDPGPRAWVVHGVRTSDDAQALRLLADPDFDLESTVLLPSTLEQIAGTDLLQTGLLAPSGHNEVRLWRLAPNRLRAHVWSEHGGLLVVSENWMPGWQATRYDGGAEGGPGEPLPVVRANLTLLGIPIPPGESTLELVYQPDSVRYGLLVSGATLTLLGLFVLGRRCLARWRLAGDRSGTPGDGA